MLPKHHKTSFFLNAGLFDNLSNFAELEERISELPTTLEKGDAFEIFAEAYFFTQKIEQAEEVWPFKSVPSSTREDMSLGTNQQDMGVDGVYKTTSGQYNAYQAKFRTRRPSLTWREISTFMGLTDNVNQRVLFTNCNDMPSVINDRTGFHCIRGNDLDRLQKNDFETILKWLQSGDIEVARKAPLPHQADAIKNILDTLKYENRATALMACGTGKTLVALWVAEQMDCKGILVLLPSLTLVRQTLHEWLREAEWQHLSYLCVCSDPTVASKELDSIKINQSDLDFSVTTEGSAVMQFLSQNTKGVKIVFSTYQSAHIVAEGMNNNYRFDLGIFDEAHKTAGREGKKFGFALKDDNLTIKKRLFLTATPRHYNLNKRNEEGDLDLVYSMDSTDVYGNIAHELSFAEAARQNIICNYKVIISVVTSEQVSREILRRGEVLIKGDAVNAQLVAHQIAFKEAINKYKIKRVFTFHKSIKAAKSFTENSSEGIRTHLPKFNTFHVNGTMTTAAREGVMNEFRDSDYSVISNARCLTEGVDLPAVDMIAFMSPKKSKVDIVQATGRAMRKDPHNPGKTIGYILVPLCLEIVAGESIEEAVAKASFEEVWNILQALHEQDEILTDVIRQIQEDKGMGKRQKSDNFNEIIETLAVNIPLNILRESVTAECVDKLGYSWDMRYGELLEYNEKHGNCNVPITYTENKQLVNWVSTQRTKYRNKNITSDQINRLEKIDFIWDISELQWDSMYDELKEYKQEYGDCNTLSNLRENKSLSFWVSNQRAKYKNKKLSNERIKLLEDIGFEWSQAYRAPREFAEKWNKMYEKLKEYKQEHGDCNVPSTYQKNKSLAIWIRNQRADYNEGTLSEDRIKHLTNIGFKWRLKQRLPWEERFTALEEYKQTYGNCLVPYPYMENKQLGSWVQGQRKNYKDGRLSEEQINRLENIGFVWDIYDFAWQEMFEALKEYREEHGDCNVPLDWSENNQLADWVNAQCARYKSRNLSKERIERLEDIGFEWTETSGKHQKKWETMFEALIKFKEEHGDCNVPHDWTGAKQLLTWVNTQRTRYKRKILNKERIKRLEDIGFEWTVTFGRAYKNWESMFETLKKYKEEHGDCNVPTDWENPKLVTWISTQRKRFKNKLITKDQIKRLEEMGFELNEVFGRAYKNWESMFETLKKYKNEHGDCNVPRDWEEPKLVNWISTQRTRYRNKNITKDQIKRLEDIGFEWTVIFGKVYKNWESMFETLKKYKDEYGDCNVPLGWDNPKLVNWVRVQRNNYRNKQLSKDQIKRLEEMGFAWATNASRNLHNDWEAMLEALKEYKDEHGDCNVTADWKNPRLMNWVRVQRNNYRNNQLSQDYIKYLEDIGFEWTAKVKRLEDTDFERTVDFRKLQKKWETMFEALIKFKEEHGDCNVPHDWTEPRLVNWVRVQRNNYRNNQLSKDYIKRLDDLGFAWDLQWDAMFKVLKEYKEEYGDCNITAYWVANKQLAPWVSKQRVNYRRMKLGKDQIKRLEGIGFEWKIRE